jgi:hypothetical protein
MELLHLNELKIQFLSFWKIHVHHLLIETIGISSINIMADCCHLATANSAWTIFSPSLSYPFRSQGRNRDAEEPCPRLTSNTVAN